MRQVLGIIACACAVSACSACFAAEDLLLNGDFAAADERGVPAHWWVGRSGQDVRIDGNDAPAGAQQSLRVDVRAEARNHGEIGQRPTGLRKNASYVLEGAIKSSAAGLGFLQIKLYREGKELRRITSDTSGTEWKEIVKQFSTGPADKVEILCRYLQGQEAVGQSVWFAQLRLTEAGPLRLVSGRAVATFHSLGIHVTYRGDLGGRDACRVRYRKRGENAWRRGLDLIPCASGNEFRGSLFHLEQDTEYEVACELAGPGAAASGAPPVQLPVQLPVMLTARTWAEDVPIGEVRRLPAGVSREPLVIRDRGRPDAWILYRAPEGETCTVDAGRKSESAVLFENAAYVILEGANLRGGVRHCVHVLRSHHVRIRRCDISGWGDAGTRREGPGRGLYVDAKGRPINYHAGVCVDRGSSQVVVEDNFIHDPRGTANSWKYGHPMGPQGIFLKYTAGNLVVRNNDLIGSEKHWWNDAIESMPNRAVGGGPHRDTDIHGNVLAFSNDDGTELDGGQVNVRYWNNWIDKALCGISCAPNVKGPSYIFGNLIAGLGEERGSAGSAFKMGGGVTWSPGVSVVLHNTIYGKGGGLCSVGFGSEKDRGGYVAFSRNNLFAGPGGRDVTNVSKDPRNDFDYDLIGRGGVSLPPGSEKHAVRARPRFVDAPAGDFRLVPGSPGIDAGARLPGVNDGFAGGGPDMGAFERRPGESPVFPRRPSGMLALPLRVRLEELQGRQTARAEVRLFVPHSAGRRWTAHPNSPWLACVPPSGGAGQRRVAITVSRAELELRPYRGAVTFRTDTGLNRTVMVDLKVYHARPVAIAFEAEEGEVTGGFERVKDPSASGGAYLHPPEGAEPGSVAFSFEVPEDGVYYVAALCMVPGPDPGVHDSFLASIDGAGKRIWDLSGHGVNRWGWGLVNARNEEYPCRFRLSKGSHRLVIHSRERLSRLDRVVLTNNPYPEEPRGAAE